MNLVLLTKTVILKKIYYDENDNNVVIDQEEYDYRIYPQDVANMIKAFAIYAKYLIDIGVIKRVKLQIKCFGYDYSEHYGL